MFIRLFGETNEEQFEFLKRQLIITAICIVVGGIIALIGFPQALAVAFAIPCYFMWGKRAMISLFGVATFGAIFAGGRNIIWVVFILVAYLMIGYIAALICFALGLGRFVYLLTDRIKQKQVEAQAEEAER